MHHVVVEVRYPLSPLRLISARQQRDAPTVFGDEERKWERIRTMLYVLYSLLYAAAVFIKRGASPQETKKAQSVLTNTQELAVSWT